MDWFKGTKYRSPSHISWAFFSFSLRYLRSVEYLCGWKMVKIHASYLSHQGTRSVNWAAATAARRRARSVRMAAEHGSLAKNWPAEWLGQAQTTDRSDRGWGIWGWMAPRNKRSKKMETWWHVHMTHIIYIYIYKYDIYIICENSHMITVSTGFDFSILFWWWLYPSFGEADIFHPLLTIGQGSGYHTQTRPGRRIILCLYRGFHP